MTHSNLLLAYLEIIVEILKYSDWGYWTHFFKNLTSSPTSVTITFFIIIIILIF
jgi:hypothetical protein